MALVLQSLLAVLVKWCSVQPTQLMNHQLPSKKVRIYLSPQCRIPSKHPWHGSRIAIASWNPLSSLLPWHSRKHLSGSARCGRLIPDIPAGWPSLSSIPYPKRMDAHGSNSEPGISSRSCRYLILGEWDDNKPRLKEAQLQMEIKHDAPWLQEAELAKLNTKRL